MEGEPTEENTFRTELMDILCREYGRRNVAEYENGKIRIRTDDGFVNAWTDGNNVVLNSCLTDPNGEILIIPKEDIAGYIPRVANMYICPALYETRSNENYVPHYNFMLHESDLEYPESVVMVIDKLAFLAKVASGFWNDTGSEQDPDDASQGCLRGPMNIQTIHPVP